MSAVLGLLFGPVRWFIMGIQMLRWAGPRRNDLVHQAATYKVKGEDVPITLTDELVRRDHEAAAGWLRVAVMYGVVATGLAGFTTIQWRENDAAKDKMVDKVKVAEASEAIAQRIAKENFDAWKAAEARVKTLQFKIDVSSGEREKLITVNVAQKTAIRKKRAESEAKLPISEPITPADWLSIQTAGGGDSASGSGDIRATRGLHEGPR